MTTHDHPRYIVLTATEMPTLSGKLGLLKAFGRYPPTDEIEFVVNPEIVKDATMMYLIDRQAMEDIAAPDIMRAFEDGAYDDHFKTMPVVRR